MSDPTEDREQLALLAISARPMQLRSVGGDLTGEVNPLYSWLETILEGTGTASHVAHCICLSEKAKDMKNNGRWKCFSDFKQRLHLVACLL